MEPIDRAGGIPTRADVGRLTVAVALIALSGGALAASSFGVDCDRSGADLLTTTESAADELSVSVVDLTDDESAIGINTTLDDAADADSSAAPLLFLAPRVASIVEDVFGDSRAGRDLVLPRRADISRSRSIAPLADSADEPSEPPSAKPESGLEAQPAAKPALPRIQREMYRTDI